MKIFLVILLFLIGLSSCNLNTYSELTIDGFGRNNKIVDRKSTAASTSGCLGVDGVISLKINGLSKDTIDGYIYDATTKEPVPYSKIYFITNQNDSTKAVSNFDGIFKIENNPLYESIFTTNLGYNDLKINLK